VDVDRIGAAVSTGANGSGEKRAPLSSATLEHREDRETDDE
jgi:hypothetical protein